MTSSSWATIHNATFGPDGVLWSRVGPQVHGSAFYYIYTSYNGVVKSGRERSPRGDFCKYTVPTYRLLRNASKDPVTAKRTLKISEAYITFYVWRAQQSRCCRHQFRHPYIPQYSYYNAIPFWASPLTKHHDGERVAFGTAWDVGVTQLGLHCNYNPHKGNKVRLYSWSSALWRGRGFAGSTELSTQ